MIEMTVKEVCVALENQVVDITLSENLLIDSKAYREPENQPSELIS